MDYQLVACNVQHELYKTNTVDLNDEAIYDLSDLSLSNPLTLPFAAANLSVPFYLEWRL